MKEEKKQKTGIKMAKEDNEIIEMIGKALEKKKERKIGDYFDGSQVGARSQIERLFNRAQYISITLQE